MLSDIKKTIKSLETQVDDLEARVQLSDEAMGNLNALYGLIWVEACYDPSNAECQKLAASCLPLITALNRELKFKK